MFTKLQLLQFIFLLHLPLIINKKLHIQKNVNIVKKLKEIHMTILTKRQTLSQNNANQKDSLVDSVRILSNITKKDIEKSYNINGIYDTEAYYSNRYGWTLRKTVD